MDKIKASILVIGFQKEDNKMHPHLYDFLQNLKDTYDDVVYILDEDRGWGLCAIDRYIRSIKSDLRIAHFKKLFYDLINLLFCLRFYISRRGKFITRIKNVSLRHSKACVLAIDNYAFFFAQKYFLGNVVLWSYDILTEDCTTRIKNGFLEKLVTYDSKHPSKAKVLMIQDEQRKRILEESMGVSFPCTVYLPVGLNDSEFCRDAAKNRQKRNAFSTVNVVQVGYIAGHRRSHELIEAYQNWPATYELHLHGYIEIDKRIIDGARRKPTVSELIYGHDVFPRLLNNYDVGFVGYKEQDGNHKYLENASAQLVMFLRLGMPVIACSSFSSFNDFVIEEKIGVGVSSMEETSAAIKEVIDNYSLFSYNARKLYETRFDLKSIFDNYLIKAFEPLLG